MTEPSKLVSKWAIKYVVEKADFGPLMPSDIEGIAKLLDRAAGEVARVAWTVAAPEFPEFIACVWERLGLDAGEVCESSETALPDIDPQDGPYPASEPKTSAMPSEKPKATNANFVSEPIPGPSCSYCGAELTPTGYRCASCGLGTEPTAVPSAEQRGDDRCGNCDHHSDLHSIHGCTVRIQLEDGKTMVDCPCGWDNLQASCESSVRSTDQPGDAGT